MTLSLYVCLGLQLTSAALTVRPRNTVVVQGERAVLHCQTNTTTSSTAAAALSWKFTSTDGVDKGFIYNDDGQNGRYSERGVSVHINYTSGDHPLVFNSTVLADAGTYTCQDGGGIGEAHAAWIAVLG